MNKIKLLVLLLCFIVISPATASSNEQDEKLLLNRLLHLDNEKYYTKNDEGKLFYNSLLEHKDWEKLYIKYSKFNMKNKELTETEIRYLLFIGFIAKNSLDAAISESLSSDLVPIFNKNKILVLSSLSEISFLIPSTCYYLNKYFGFEGKNQDIKTSFIKENKESIIHALGKIKGEECISYFITK